MTSVHYSDSRLPLQTCLPGCCIQIAMPLDITRRTPLVSDIAQREKTPFARRISRWFAEPLISAIKTGPFSANSKVAPSWTSATAFSSASGRPRSSG